MAEVSVLDKYRELSSAKAPAECKIGLVDPQPNTIRGTQIYEVGEGFATVAESIILEFR